MDQLRAWFTTYDADLERVRRFWRGEGRCLVSAHATTHEYRQVFDDGTIPAAAPRHLEAQARLPGTNLPSPFCDATAYYRHLLATCDEDVRFWFACADDTPEMVAFARECAARG